MASVDLLQTRVISGALIIRGKTYDILSIDISGGVNIIPSAAVTVATGRQLQTLKANAIHTDGSVWNYMEPAEVWVQLSGRKSVKGNWSNVKTKVFEGWITQLTVSNSENSSVAVVHLAHWLLGLTFGSIISPYLNPGNPGSYIQQAVNSLTGSDGAGDDPGRSFSTVAATVKFQDQIGQDFWGAIKEFFKQLSADGNVSIVQSDIEALNVKLSVRNQQGLDILENIKSQDMALQIEGAASGEIAKAAAAQIAGQGVINAFQNSFWSRIVGGYAPLFMFAIIPRDPKEKGALCVPYLPGTRNVYTPSESTKPGIAISADDYYQGEMSRMLTRPIRAVVLTSVAPMLSNAGLMREAPLVSQGGIYQPKQDSTGTVLTMSAPPWLAAPLSFGLFGSVNLGSKDKNATKGIQGPPQPTSPVTTPKVITEGSSMLLARYARAMYVQEVLRERFMRVTGRLRFDICAGSTIAVEVAREKFIGQQDQLAGIMIGCVQQYTISLNSESGSASTSYQLSHVRTIRENQEDATSIDKHPFYKTVWAGAELIEGI